MLASMIRYDRGGAILLGLLVVAAVVVPVCNLYFPEDSPLHISTYTVTLLGKYLCFALLALSPNRGRRSGYPPNQIARRGHAPWSGSG